MGARDKIQIVKPTSLFRYRSLAKDAVENELSSIQNDYLWCSPFTELNDPMEGSYEASFRLKKLGHFLDVKAKIFDAKAALRVCSFSETNDNAVMWAHYADQFKGICIEYDFERLLMLNGCFTRVVYNETPYRVSVHALTDNELARKILSHKSYKWLYEREWRFFQESVNGKCQLATRSISCIYLGNKIPEAAKLKLDKLLSRKGIKHKVMDFGGYSIKFR